MFARLRSTTIAQRVVIALLGVALPSLFLSLGGILLLSRDMLATEIRGRLETLADEKARAIEDYAESVRRGIRSLSYSRSIVDAAAAYGDAFAAAERDSALLRTDRTFRPLLTRYLEALDYYDLFLISPAGDVVFSVMGESDLHTNLKSGPFAKTVFAQVVSDAMRTLEPAMSSLEPYAPTGDVAAFAAAPVFFDSRLIGFVAAQLHRRNLYRIVTDYTRLGHTGETVLGRADGDGLLIVAPLRSLPDAAFKHRIPYTPDRLPPLALAIRGESGSGLTVDGRGVEALAAWRPLPALRLGMVVKIDTAEAFAEISRLNRLAAALVLGTAAAVLAASLALGGAIARPIRRLKDASERIAAGDYATRAQPEGGREIAGLAESLNQMVGRVEATEATLRQALAHQGKLIRDLQAAQQAAHASEAMLRMIFNSAADGIVTIGADGTILSANSATERMFGCSVMELVGRNVGMLMPEPYRSRHAGFIKAFLDGGERRMIGRRRELEAVRKDGTRFPIELAVSAVCGDDGRWVFTGLLSDITARRAAGDQIRKLSRAIEASPVIVLITDVRGNLEYVNRTFVELTGYQPEEVIGRTPGIVKSGKAPPEVYAEMWRTISAGGVWHGEFNNRRKDGSEYWVSASISPIRGDDGTIMHYVAVEEDITERRAMEERLRRSEERFNTGQRFANIGTWDWTIATGELFWSDRIAPLFGYEPGMLQTSYANFLNAIHPEDRDMVTAAVEACVAGTADYDIEHRIVWPDGSVHWVRERGNVVRDETGAAVRMLGVVIDIDAMKQAEDELRKATAQAETANMAKSEFLSRMSHELRTPMNAILGFSQLMRTSRKDPLTPKQQDYMAMIEKGGEHLLALINEVLDLARIEAGRMSLSIEDIDAVPLIDECLSLTRTMADKRGITVIDQTGGRPLRLFADYTRTKQVLLNLLSNAVKYNRENGRITLGLSDGAPGFLRISVADTGPGIPPDRQDELFVPFSRLDAGDSQIEGTGIGLTITRKLVEQMGGAIGFDSQVGIGSTFWFELPLAGDGSAAGRPQAAEAAARPELRLGRRRTLLYVEDNPANLRLMEEIIAEAGDMELMSAHTAELGLELAAARRPDVIVLDINLPGIDGIEAVRRLRALPGTAATPIFALSANAMPGTVQRALDAGFDKYLTKPVKIADIMAALGEVLGTESG